MICFRTSLVVAALWTAGCASTPPVPPDEEKPGIREPLMDATGSPPLGTPRAKITPGDVLEDEEE